MARISPLDLYTTKHTTRAPKLATARQQALLVRLITTAGKQTYWRHKAALNIPHATPVTRLTRKQAHSLIDSIKKQLNKGTRHEQ